MRPMFNLNPLIPTGLNASTRSELRALQKARTHELEGLKGLQVTRKQGGLRDTILWGLF